ncbi:MAG TPA: GNAT family N-acetyltransferase [Caulobacteraceae bacterium]|jgi:ribosomal protein S18 acetylase RimI-like enzyme|nr:GNAT family N-acetyltransferase [Caulobacteraceae bacterium]
MAEPRVRDARPDDLDAIYAIALATGLAGADAAHLYRDPKLVGRLYAAPYAVLEPGLALVVEDDSGVGGYIVGALDTLAFEARLGREWWPALRPRHPDPTGDPKDWGLDEIGAWQIHHRRPPPARITDPYPSHLHVNLLPRLQGQGLGRRLIDAWLARAAAAGSRGMHLGVNPANQRALRFYRAYGLEEFRFPRPKAQPDTIYFVRALEAPPR